MREEKHTNHTFKCATFFSFTGQSTDDNEDREDIIPLFRHPRNIDGEKIKFLLGSQVLSEGVNLYNVREVHILDAHLNISRINQAIGRAIRYCAHVDRVSVENPEPKIKVYRYAASLPKQKGKSKTKQDLSVEETTWQHAETKAILIKKIEDMMKEIAIDCPLQYNANGVKCFDQSSLFDKNKKKYKTLSNKEIDTDTYNRDLSNKLTRRFLNKIKQLFRRRVYYKLSEIELELKVSFEDKFFLYRAIEILCPSSDTDKNNFKEIFKDAFNRLGYLIFRQEYYIFQPWVFEEYAPIYYRERPTVLSFQPVSLKEYMVDQKLITRVSDKSININTYEKYLTYYQQFTEGDYVGIIRINKYGEDELRLRTKQKETQMKRGKGVVSYEGADCKTKPIKWLLEVFDHFGVKPVSKSNRSKICAQLKDYLYKLERTTNKIYIILPDDHPDFPIKKN